MIYTLEELTNYASNATRAVSTSVQINGKWVPARPISGTFRWEKLKAAWEVLRGRADAFTWPGGQ